MDWDFKDYPKIAFFAFCLAFFFLLLRSFVFGDVGRYQLGLFDARAMVIDTTNGHVYSIRGGKLIFQPNE